MLNCNSQTLLLAATQATDVVLFTWSSWLQSQVRAGTIIDLGSMLRPRLPPTLMQVDCAVVYRAGRTQLPAARRLLDMILDQRKSRARTGSRRDPPAAPATLKRLQAEARRGTGS